MKTALVTGSSRGIGAEIARRLAKDGFQIVLHYTEAKAEAQVLQKELGAACVGVVQADLMSSKETERLWFEATAYAPISVLINNAGVYEQIPFWSAESFEENRQKMFRINFDAPCELMRLAIAEFELHEGGKVLNVASRVGFRGEAGASMYAASKAALINVTRSLAVEYAGSAIQFFGIAPGWVDTSMTRKGMEDRLPQILETIPAGRMATPADCANTASFLLSEGSEYLSGSVIDINGASYFH
jgi:3-oxoacyl-[acyl-carrier protein] reductase